MADKPIKSLTLIGLNDRYIFDSNPLYVTLGAENGGYVINRTFAEVRAAYDKKQSVYCMAGTMRLPLAGISADTAMFSASNKNNIFRVVVKADGTVEHQSYKCVLEEDMPATTYYGSLHNAVTDITAGTADNALSGSDGAKVRVTSADGVWVLELLEDLTEGQKITIARDVHLRLCGHKLELNPGAYIIFSAGTHCAVYGGVSQADGSAGKITAVPAAAAAATAIAANGDTLTVEGVELTMVGATTGGMYGVNFGKTGRYLKLSGCGVLAHNTGVPNTAVRAVCGTSNPDAPDRLVEIDDCVISATGDHAGACSVYGGCDTVVRRTTVNALAPTEGYAYGILNMADCSTVIDSCSVDARITGDLEVVHAYAINNEGSAQIIDTTAFASSLVLGFAEGLHNAEAAVANVNGGSFEALYAGEAEGTGAFATANYGSLWAKNARFFGDSRHGNTPSTFSNGVRNYGIAYLDNCAVTGTHAGCSNQGKALYVNGGIYTGNWHGGFYFAQDPDYVAYVNDAHIRDCIYEGQFPETNVVNATNCWGAVYIGGHADADNIVVYMDGCTFEGYKHAICMRGSLGEINNTVNLSNCTFLPRKYGEELCTINYHNNTHRVNVGAGCNITEEQIFISDGSEQVEGMMNFTEKLYRRVAPDKQLTGRDYNALAVFLIKEE